MTFNLFEVNNKTFLTVVCRLVAVRCIWAFKCKCSDEMCAVAAARGGGHTYQHKLSLATQESCVSIFQCYEINKSVMVNFRLIKCLFFNFDACLSVKQYNILNNTIWRNFAAKYQYSLLWPETPKSMK